MKTGYSPLMAGATGLFVGYLPWAPGTFGTVAGLLPALLLSCLAPPLSLAILAVFIGLAVGIAHAAERRLGRNDPGCIVIDEIAGIMVTLWALPVTPWIVGGGFLVFRCLDIAKPFPIRYLEKNLPGGAGIVFDDVLAGIFANLILRIVLQAGGIPPFSP